MIELSNLRKIQDGDWTKLTIDISVSLLNGGGGGAKEFPPTMWIGVKNENAHMLADDVYNAFLLIPLYMGMYYKSDIVIHGHVSKSLYRNVMIYLQDLLCDFSDDLSRINITVDGFKEAKADPDAHIIGTGISCGVDSLTTIYDRYLHEDDPDYRINTLFFFSSGQHGNGFGDEESERLFHARFADSKKAADKLGLPAVMIDTNLHYFFMGRFGGFLKTAHLAFWSCLMCLERVIRKYYISTAYSYGQVMRSGEHSHDNEIDGYAQHFILPLISTQNMEFISEGYQYTRNQKVEHIADWDIAHEHLDVCFDYHPNCSECSKCVRTLQPIEALGRLEDFSQVFDIEKYRRNSFRNKCILVLTKDDDGFLNDNYTFCKSHGLKLPSVPLALLVMLFHRPKLSIRWLLSAIIGRNGYQKLRKFLKRS